MLIGLLGGGGVVVSNIPIDAIATYIQDAFPQNLPNLEKSRCVVIDGGTVYLDTCNQNFRYLFKILVDESIPFEERQKLARSTLTRYLDLRTINGRTNFVLCTAFILALLSAQNPGGFFIMIQNLIQAIKEGKISKKLARAIIRRLMLIQSYLSLQMLKIQ